MLTREQNIFLAKKKFVDLVYDAAYLKGCKVTFPKTQTIIEGAMVSGVSVNDIQTVLNLSDAWKYCIETIDTPLTLEFICKINEIVSRNEGLEWGMLRTGRVGVGDFIPPAPVKEKVIEDIERINNIKDAVERALEYFAYACKQQLFWDGNKRTSTIISSKILIEAGEGILSIGKDMAEEFHTTLNDWYVNDKLEPLKECLHKCIETLELE